MPPTEAPDRGSSDGHNPCTRSVLSGSRRPAAATGRGRASCHLLRLRNSFFRVRYSGRARTQHSSPGNPRGELGGAPERCAGDHAAQLDPGSLMNSPRGSRLHRARPGSTELPGWRRGARAGRDEPPPPCSSGRTFRRCGPALVRHAQRRRRACNGRARRRPSPPISTTRDRLIEGRLTSASDVNHTMHVHHRTRARPIGYIMIKNEECCRTTVDAGGNADYGATSSHDATKAAPRAAKGGVPTISPLDRTWHTACIARAPRRRRDVPHGFRKSTALMTTLAST
jgi:hypothetical protein